MNLMYENYKTFLNCRREELRKESMSDLLNQHVECRFYIIYLGNVLGSISLFFFESGQ